LILFAGMIVGWIVFLLIILSAAGAYLLLGAPWFPWPEMLAEWGLDIGNGVSAP